MLNIFFLSVLIISQFCNQACFAEDETDGGTEETESCGEPESPPIILLKDDPKMKIISGEDVRPHSWPWQVSLQWRNGEDKYMHICGGSLVAPARVISAAHCLYFSQNPLDYIVVLGSHNLKTRESSRKIYNIKNFTYPKENDIKKFEIPFDLLIISLVRDVEYGNSISPVCLAQKTVPMDAPCYVTGWGKNESFSSEKYSAVLKQIDIPIVNSSYCLEVANYKKVFNPKRHICAGHLEGGADSCQGDSGGPLVCQENKRWYLYGVVSTGYGCGLRNTPGLYTRISFYYRWILNQL